MTLFICSKVEDLMNKKMIKMDIPEITLNMTVDDLYEKVASHLTISADSVELVSYGRFLQRGKTLGYYGVRSSSVIFVHKKRPKRKITSTEIHPVDQTEAHRIVVALRTALVNPDFRNIIDKLKEKEAQENLMAVTPGLGDDPTAMAILLDYDMLSLCSEHENIMKVLEKHPSLGDAATFLAAQFHEEHASADIFRRSPRPAYSLDEMISDDDEAEMLDSYNQAGPSSGQPPAPSNEQLARLLREAIATANAAQNPTRSSTSSMSSSSRVAPAVASSSQVITSEMLQAALGFVNPSSTPAVPPSRSQAVPTAPPTSRDWSAELRQMRELGITDELQCIQALEATNGNVEQALDIIFNA
jgi:hypothetical protein